MSDSRAEQAGQPVAVSESKVERDRRVLLEAQSRGGAAKWGAYVKLSGPGWLQGAITLGSGSLAGSLYIGVIGGYGLLWLQPLMMILGVVMLCAIGYVTLSTGQRPFAAINQHVSPVLGWSWLIAAMLANLVWAMPQFSIGAAALQQNLLPGLLGDEAGSMTGRYIAVALLFGVSFLVVWFYDSGGRGLRLFEVVLKLMVGVVVVSFFGVVVAMTFSGQGLDWGAVLGGFIPDLSLLSRVSDVYTPYLEASAGGDYWHDEILNTQRERMVAAAATAVGINMTFLLPYSMLRKGWDRTFRGLAVFDLSTGLFIPFVLATGCVVIAAGSQFHGKYDPGLTGEGPATPVTASLTADYHRRLEGRLTADLTPQQAAAITADQKTAMADALPLADKQLAAMLVTRDANTLALSLETLTGRGVAQYIFGIGVLGMAVSTIIILMLINGFCLTEMLGVPAGGLVHRVGALLPGLTGSLGFLFLWSKGANFWLAVPTSMFGMVLLPIAYITFFLMMNNRALLGEARLRGGRKLAVNAVMLVALSAATVGAGWSIWSQTRPVPGTAVPMRWIGIGIVTAIAVAALLVHLVRSGRATNRG